MSQSHKYIVISTEGDDGTPEVSVVPDVWVVGELCYFPPTPNFKSKILKGVLPSSNWTGFEFKRLSKRAYGNCAYFLKGKLSLHICNFLFRQINMTRHIRRANGVLLTPTLNPKMTRSYVVWKNENILYKVIFLSQRISIKCSSRPMQMLVVRPQIRCLHVRTRSPHALWQNPTS